ncbi:unnamed protein product [Angiostrongylus costaricensis]|uniref:Uncharacterized protein n=1 Tax=Angiostrongylus costaricensis TaxID=334426 RepID=A0A0R3Q2F8_ANGCS|nr:unnamed protein product [Angiostrongylus costaricensis]
MTRRDPPVYRATAAILLDKPGINVPTPERWAACAVAPTDDLPHKLNLWTSGRHLRSRTRSVKDGVIVNGCSNQISPTNFDSMKFDDQGWHPLDLSMNKPAENCAPPVAVSSEVSCVNEELPFTVRRVTFSF